MQAQRLALNWKPNILLTLLLPFLLQASLDQKVPITAIVQDAMLSEIASREASERLGDDD